MRLCRERIPTVMHEEPKKYEDAVWRKHMAEVVKTFNALSVREKAGAEVVKKIDSTCVVEQCIDPVFLLSAEEWRELVEKNDIRKRLTERSIVYYSVNATTYEDLHWENMCDCARQLGCRLSAVGIQGSNKFIPSSAWVRPSPLEFLQMIIDADYVVTNSFHGLVFAILLHKQFAFIPQKDLGGGDPNLRQRELLDWLSLDDRRVSGFFNAGDMTTKLQELINWRDTGEKVDVERERCLRWLKGALS